MEKVNEDASLEFKWLKKRGVGGKNKEVQFYESFIYDGVKYKLYDCVYMYKDGLQYPYIGKLTKIWERSGKLKKVKVHWFFLPGEISQWLGETEILENEILFASGEGPGLADINPLEAIAGPCNVVCISKDSRNSQPSDEELKAADFIFYRTFDVGSCTIMDKMDDKVGGLEIEYIFNREEGEKVIPISDTCDTKEEDADPIISSKAQKILTNTAPNMLKEDAKGGPLDNGIPNLMERNEESTSHERPVKKIKSDKGVEAGVCGSEKKKDLPSMKPKADNDEMKVSIVPVEKVENERNKTPIGSNKLHDQPSKKINSDVKKQPQEKPVQPKVVQDSEKSTVDSKSKQEEKLPAVVNGLKTSETSGTKENQMNGKISGKVTDQLGGKKLKRSRDDGSFKVPDDKKIDNDIKEKDLVANSADGTNLKTSETSGTTINQKNGKISGKVTNDLEGKKSKRTSDDGFSKVPANNGLKTSETSGTKENQMNGTISGKVTDELGGKKLKRSRDDGSFKVPADKKIDIDIKEKDLVAHSADGTNLKTSETTSGTTINQKNDKISGKVTDDLEGKKPKRTSDDGCSKVPTNKNIDVSMNGKDLVAKSELSKGKSKSGNLDSLGNTNNMEAKEEQSDEKKNKISMNKSSKVSALSTDKDKKNKYQEFVVTRKPKPESSTWFTLAPWEDRLNTAYNQGTAILLHNLRPDYTSEDVEDIIWHAFNKEDCDAKILQRTAVSSPHYKQALVLLKTKEAAQRILAELDAECLMLSDDRPLVATPCPPVSTKKNPTFFGHLAVDKARIQNQREDEAVSTSHFSQPNTIEYDMAMEWCLEQIRSEKHWAKLHKQQGLKLQKLRKELKQKPA
ncbi:hypothetical protein SSX86_001475 [Deinandra increscens subsp. villosa]|uniref:BAH domain-containing protein n=1 Tax=Deinandra increscens subsp. villosa TaxID=3103831 RepID=A0AAP0DW91_9ASTR